MIDKNKRLFIFGMGYSAGHIAEHLRAHGWHVEGTGRNGEWNFADMHHVRNRLMLASHILSSVPPDRETGLDPVLERYGENLRASSAGWIGYLSSTGVYGDVQGAWVDEHSPTGRGRRSARSAADQAWQALDRGRVGNGQSDQATGRVRIFRLPGIYGPGRSVLERIRAGKAQRIAAPGQVFSRIHVSDIARAIALSAQDPASPAGIFNLADDEPCAHSDVIAYGCRLLGQQPPAPVPLERAGLSDAARGFYTENRRVASGRARRLLGWSPQYPDYRAGLAAIIRPY